MKKHKNQLQRLSIDISFGYRTSLLARKAKIITFSYLCQDWIYNATLRIPAAELHKQAEIGSKTGQK